MRSSSKKRWSIAANIILSICSFLAIMPFLLLIIASLTDDTVAMTDGYSYFPAKWSLSAYEYIANQAEMIGRAYFMTIIVTVIGTIMRWNILLRKVLLKSLLERIQKIIYHKKLFYTDEHDVKTIMRPSSGRPAIMLFCGSAKSK